MEDLGVPASMSDLFRLYGRYIAEQVASRNKRPENFEDIYQAVCLRLVEGNIIEKFHERMGRSRPDSLSTEEVCLHLGVTVEGWLRAASRYADGDRTIPWMPTPVAGEGIDAIYSVDEVERYESLVHRHHDVVASSECLIPRLSGAKFRTYLQFCVHNAWANWCRTHSRRHKERPIDWFLSARQDDGGKLATAELFDHPAVADTQESFLRMSACVESRQAVEALSRVGVGEDFLALLTDGYTAQEACRKLRMSRTMVRKIERVLAG